jgi:hypothetical protein
MQAVCMVYHVDESSIRKSINDVSMAIMLNSYFEYLFQKPLLDCKPREVNQLRDSEARYYAWRKKPTPSFNRVLETLDKILPNL